MTETEKKHFEEYSEMKFANKGTEKITYIKG